MTFLSNRNDNILVKYVGRMNKRTGLDSCVWEREWVNAAKDPLRDAKDATECYTRSTQRDAEEQMQDCNKIQVKKENYLQKAVSEFPTSCSFVVH